ncbi:putative transcriptional regulator [Methylocaldum marinum]|uniref:Putative transcriptional regulator n=1 Tax=Methylocaldum marinum TaxID=1432792 RepID=A0A250KWA4_9GAMM|nr:CopG family ribbon-helix-helix protein [Methylocaldum marinum]BBA34049.1 putative transcriptional regulator [Methylocaldum marinum]
MTTEAFTVRTDGETVKRLDQLAAQLDRSRNYLVNQAIQEYLKLHAWQIQKIEAGIAAADRGDVIPHEDVMGEMDALIEEKIRAFEDRS